MKTLSFGEVAILAVFAVLMSLAGCATSPDYGLEKFLPGVGSRVVSGLPKFSSPVAEQFGITAPGDQNLVVLNGTPFYGRVFIYGKEVAQLAPGDELNGSKHFEPLNPQIPVAVLFYREYDDEKQKFGEYVGASGKIFQFVSGRPDAKSWTIQGREIQTPKGTRSPTVLGLNHPSPRAGLASRRIEIPREAWNATAGVQILNNTLFIAAVGISTARFLLLPGEASYVPLQVTMGPAQKTLLRAVFTDANGLVSGIYERSISIPERGVRAYQVFFSPLGIRR